MAGPAATIEVDVRPKVGQLIAVLRVVAKHATACADELAALAATAPEPPTTQPHQGEPPA